MFFLPHEKLQQWLSEKSQKYIHNLCSNIYMKVSKLVFLSKTSKGSFWIQGNWHLMIFSVHVVEQAVQVLMEVDHLTIHVCGSWVGLGCCCFDSSPFPINLLFVSDWDTTEMLLFMLMFRNHIEEITAGLFASWGKPTYGNFTTSFLAFFYHKVCICSVVIQVEKHEITILCEQL